MLLVCYYIINISSKKKSRVTSFSFREKELLLKFASENCYILENKQSNLVTWKDKNICCLKIADKYNSVATGCVKIFITTLIIKFFYYFDVTNISPSNKILPIHGKLLDI